MPLPVARKRIGSAEIAALLRRDIVRGTLEFRDRLPAERFLAETYQVSRGTVREALSRLEDEKLVDIRAGSGTYVVYENKSARGSPIEYARPLELIDARFALEPHVCRLAVLHASRTDFEKFEEHLAHMEESEGDPVVFAEADTDFHASLAASTGNNLLMWIIAQINSVRGQNEWTRMRNLTLEPTIIARYNAQHRQIVEAIRAREPEIAATAMKEHLETARLSLTRAAST